MSNVLKSMRLHIGIFGKRNAGKSSLINFLSGQDTSIVSDVAGTTTDVVEKVMELLPIGPVVLLDTAGIDDEGVLGEERVKKAYSCLDRIDIGLIVCDYNGIDAFELNLVEEFKKRQTPFAFVVTKNDIAKISAAKLSEINQITENVLDMSIKDDNFLNLLKSLIVNIMPSGFFDEEKILNDIVDKGDVVVQVIPIDKQAPKGRLILPQVRTIRNLLDNSVISVVVGEDELENVLSILKNKPKLVVTDSQAFSFVNSVVPNDILLTSYSIIFARLKGDLSQFVEGAKKISSLKDGDKVLVCESCSHHASCDDIGRVKIPNLIKKFTSKFLVFDTYSGHDFPNNLAEYSLIIHCGACMTNKKEVLSRILLANKSNVPITNYGIAIAYCLNILDRAVEVFNL